jgi:CheY-like chemotaxis protein/rubrerythrin
MREIVNWLIQFENTAARFYSRAAEYFSDDQRLAELARLLAEDEEWHAEIIKKASAHMKGRESPTSLIKLDVDSKERIASLFKEWGERFTSGDATKKDFLSSIVEVEYSECNTYLLYVVNSLKDLSDEFATVPRRMQEHKRRIEDYLEALEGSDAETSRALLKIARLPDIWRDRFLLVVDDEEDIVDLLKAILETKGIVDCARNGEEALEKFNKRYYNAIILDVDMPVLGGIEFYEKVSIYSHDVKERLLFFTGGPDEERLSFFRKNGIRYIEKPARIQEIIDAVNDILEYASKCGLHPEGV